MPEQEANHCYKNMLLPSSVTDPDSNPDPDPHVFGPPGSGYISLRHGSGPDLDPDPALDPDPSIIKQK